MKIKRPHQFTSDMFNRWFDECVEPINEMLAEGVEAYGHEFKSKENRSKGTWTTWKASTDTHKALLINIEPIEKPQSKDVNTCRHEWLDFQFEHGHVENPHIMLACEHCGLVRVKE